MQRYESNGIFSRYLHSADARLVPEESFNLANIAILKEARPDREGYFYSLHHITTGWSLGFGYKYSAFELAIAIAEAVDPLMGATDVDDLKAQQPAILPVVEAAMTRYFNRDVARQVTTGRYR